jgi:hypothetical protein
VELRFDPEVFLRELDAEDFVRELLVFVERGRELRLGGGGVFAPLFRASDKPIAIACLGFFILRPLLPDLSVPRFILCMVRSTL